MKKTLIALFAALTGITVLSAPVEASPSNAGKVQKTKEMITISKFGQTWKVTKATAIDRCEKSKTDPNRKNWKLYCEYVQPVAVANNENQCRFLFWTTNCVIQNEDVVKPAEPTRQISEASNQTKKAFVPEKSQILAKAESTIGLNARRDRQTLSKKLSNANGMNIDPVRIPWCAAWMNMVLHDVGLETTGSLMARSFLAWGKPVAGEPKVGDVVVMRRGRNRNNGHVGFFYAFVEHNGVQKIAVLGGNQGKEVRISYYPITKVIAYRTAA